MEAETKKKLVLPTALAIAVLASGCVTAAPTVDAAPIDQDTAVADAGFDAGCVPPEVFDPISHSCVPIV